MRFYNYDLDNIELYVLADVFLIELIKSSGKARQSDLLWLDGSTRGGIDNNRVENIGKLYLIFTKILQLDLFRNKGESRSLYRNMSLRNMMQYVPDRTDIDKIKRLLKASGVVDIHEHSSGGKTAKNPHAHGFRINKQYHHCERVELYSLQSQQYYFKQSTYDKWPKLSKSKQHKHKDISQVSEPDTATYIDDSELFKWLEKCHLDIDIDLVKATAALDHQRHTAITSLDTALANGDMKQVEYSKEITKSQDRYSRGLGNINKIFSFRKKYGAEQTFSRSRATNRITCNVNQLERITRPYLSYHRFDIHWIDVHASHAFLLLALYDDIKGGGEAIAAEKNEYHRLWTTKEKDFYKNFAKLGSFKIEPDNLKNMFLGKHGLNAKYRPKRPSTISKIYRDNFPILEKQMRLVKTTKYLDDGDIFWKTYGKRLEKKRTTAKNLNRWEPTDILYGQLAYINHRRESEAVIQIAAKMMLDELGPTSFALTCHDALGVQRKRIPLAKKALNKAYIQVTGKRPKLIVKGT